MKKLGLIIFMAWVNLSNVYANEYEVEIQLNIMELVRVGHVSAEAEDLKKGRLQIHLVNNDTDEVILKHKLIENVSAASSTADEEKKVFVPGSTTFSAIIKGSDFMNLEIILVKTGNIFSDDEYTLGNVLVFENDYEKELRLAENSVIIVSPN